MPLLALLLLLTVYAWPRLTSSRTVNYMALVVDVCNDNFNSPGTNVPHLLQHPNPDGTRGFDLLLIQEGKAEHYRQLRDDHGDRLLPFDTYGIVQDTRSKAKAGSVIIYRYRTLAGHTLRHGKWGWTFGVSARGLLPRWIAWLRLAAGLALSGHAPPERTQRSQPRTLLLFHAALRARMTLAVRAGRWVICGMDSNQHGGPSWVHGGRWRWVSARPHSIDGFVVSARVRVDSVTELPKWTSDHNPQRMRCHVPA